MTLQAYLFNVFNKQIAISRDEAWSVSRRSYPATIFDPNQEQNNDDYGKVMDRSDPRVFRAAVPSPSDLTHYPRDVVWCPERSPG